jgi:hypothetical protein
MSVLIFATLERVGITERVHTSGYRRGEEGEKKGEKEW